MKGQHASDENQWANPTEVLQGSNEPTQPIVVISSPAGARHSRLLSPPPALPASTTPLSHAIRAFAACSQLSQACQLPDRPESAPVCLWNIRTTFSFPHFSALPPALPTCFPALPQSLPRLLGGESRHAAQQCLSDQTTAPPATGIDQKRVIARVHAAMSAFQKSSRLPLHPRPQHTATPRRRQARSTK